MAKIPSFCEISCVDISNNGYPVFDLMRDSQPGYVSSTYITFYTEDDAILAEFGQIRDTYEDKSPEVRAWLEAHSEFVMPLGTVREKVGFLENAMVYRQLTSNLAHNMKQQNACFAHYIDDQGRCHVFSRNRFSSKINSLYELPISHDPSRILIEAHALLKNLHQKGEIAPFVTYSGKAVDRIVQERKKYLDVDAQVYLTVYTAMKEVKQEIRELVIKCMPDKLFIGLGDHEGFFRHVDNKWNVFFNGNSACFERDRDAVFWMVQKILENWSCVMMSRLGVMA